MSLSEISYDHLNWWRNQPMQRQISMCWSRWHLKKGADPNTHWCFSQECSQRTLAVCKYHCLSHLRGRVMMKTMLHCEHSKVNGWICPQVVVKRLALITVKRTATTLSLLLFTHSLYPVLPHSQLIYHMSVVRLLYSWCYELARLNIKYKRVHVV